MRPVLFYTVGYPGAGKTTLAKALGYWLGATHVRGDKVGFELFKFPTYSANEVAMVRAEMDRRTIASLKAGRHVIYDAANNSQAQRAHLAQLASQQGCLAVGLWVQTPVDIARGRAAKVRDRDIVGTVARVIPPHIFTHYVTAFEQPLGESNVLTLSGTASFSLQYRRLQRQLRPYRVGLPHLI